MTRTEKVNNIVDWADRDGPLSQAIDNAVRASYDMTPLVETARLALHELHNISYTHTPTGVKLTATLLKEAIRKLY